MAYRKKPDISPGLILFQRHFLGGLYPGGQGGGEGLLTGGGILRQRKGVRK